MTDILIRYFHFLAIFVMFALLTCEHFLLKAQVHNAVFKRLAVIDMAFGISAVVALVCGLGLWFLVGKPAGFYSSNWVFHTKVTLFLLAAGVSVIPTLFILKNRKLDNDIIDVPKSIIMCVRVELLLLCIIPLLAVMMANGVGYIN